jgi:hypothetical protein
VIVPSQEPFASSNSVIVLSDRDLHIVEPIGDGMKLLQFRIAQKMFFCAAVIPLFVLQLSAQMPDKFTNLQVLPKTISKEDLMQTMRGFSFSLGERCDFCHAGKDGAKMDFPSDDKEEKRTARLMLKMVADINRDYIGKLGTTSPLQVQCVTCHHGSARPQTINALMADIIEKRDVTAAITEYRDLRMKNYGTARYDFGETPLNILTEALMKKDKNKEAAAIMEMNVEFNDQPSMWTYHLLAMAHSANRETAKAKADFQKVLALHPDDKWAKGKLEEMSKNEK